MNKTLFLIPARNGSKGIPKKNVKNLAGKPLIWYTIDFARELANDVDICVSTDGDEIISITEARGLNVPFKRPPELAQDDSSIYDTLIHALEFYESKGNYYDKILLLQPTSPFRKVEDFNEMIKIYNTSSDLDMVVSVGESRHNPYFTLHEENKNGFLVKLRNGMYVNRQDCPKVYYLNGSMYLINTQSLKKTHQFKKVKKYLMNDIYSIDINTQLDWMLCEALLKNGIVNT